MIKIHIENMWRLVLPQGCNFPNKADHDAMTNSIIQLSGKVESMRKDKAALEVLSARNMGNILN